MIKLEKQALFYFSFFSSSRFVFRMLSLSVLLLQYGTIKQFEIPDSCAFCVSLFRLFLRDRIPLTVTKSSINIMYRVLYLSLLYTGCLLLTTNMYGQQTALKTNLLFWATTTPNAGVEFGMGRQFTMDIWGAYNAWKYPDDMRLNLYLIQPEVRFWPCRKFEGHFFGVHGHYGHFNVGMIPFISGLKDHVLRGDLYGGGVTYGYHWAVGNRWGLEAMIGGGYVSMKYTKYKCAECAEASGSYSRSYFGPTRIGFSVIYFLR